ncbi:RSN1 7TM family protein [Phytophthora infestans]|uniref:RSN1 7TM family protein n=1 Tax=Phytophthora infestans TaxID=4787 RepID=A0A833TA13_PHYIN|nr:RSN1 7TM family protein [Phytophthora infestans]
MEGLPTLVVPDDPETGAIERPKTPPPIQIDEKRLLSNTTHLPVKLQALPISPIASETESTPRQPTARNEPQNLDSKQATSRQPTARDNSQTSRLPTARNEASPSGSTKTTPRPPTINDGVQEQPVETPVLIIGIDTTIEERPESARPLSPRAASLSSKDYKAMAKRAAATAKLDRLAAGNKSVFDANMNDIAALGVGMELYFLLIKYLSWAFFTMGIVSLPAIIVNYYGDGVTAKMVDPLQLAYASLGNQGVNPDIASDPTQCLPIGEIDCTGATVNTPFTTDPQKVAWIVTSSDAIYSFVFLIVYLLFRRHARRAIDAHQNEHLTPAKYAVFVRGLPPDATAREVLEHFNSRYDPTQEEIYYPLWLGCCWGRRPRRTKHSLSKEAVNCNVVNNLEHLWRPDDLGQARPVTGQTRLSMAGLARPSTVGQHGKLSPARPSTVGQSRPLTGPPGTPRLDDSVAKQEEHHMYLGTWIAEVSIAHPTGGLLRTFLAMEVLTRKISEAQALVSILTQEKEQAELALQNWAPPPGKKNPKKPKSTFKKADELLLQATTKKLERLQAAMTKKTSKLKALKQANKQLQEQQKQEAEAAAADNTCTPGQAKTVKKKKAPDAKPFDLNACECAFVVFNNLESRRRCLQDYRRSDQWLPLVAAPEPSNILWENLEVTAQSRRLRRSFTNAVTFLLLLLSGVIISAAQSAQQTFKDKAPPAGLCESTLPEIFYASPDFLDAKATWSLEWDVNATCAPGDSGETRYHVAYSNGILNDITVEKPTSPVNELHRCIDPCVSEKSNTKCNTLACFSGAAREETGEDCETYLASHALYCLCTAQLQSSIAEFGVIDGPQELWNTYVPCRGFLTDFLAKNAFIVIASAVVVIVNIVLKSTLRGFASFERHTSESAKASAVALKMFAAQFLNTAIIVLVVNAALSLSAIPVLGELFRGKYSDFQRDWYPTVGMGVTMTMLINAIMPQCILLLQLCVISPLKRCLARRTVRTQEKMDQLYAGPKFDLAIRYPMVLNSVFVTLVFCGGSPVLLFIATLACTATFWIDKLSLLWLYSVKTAYDEALGETVLGLLPWALVAHLGFSSWMYGNTDLLKAPTLKLGWVFELFGLSTDGATDTEEMYNKLVAQATTFDPLGKNGFIVKVLHVNVMLMFFLFVLVLAGILLSAVWVRVLLPVLRNTVGRILLAIWSRLRPLFRFCRCRCSCFRRRKNVVKPEPSSDDPPAQRPPTEGFAKVAAELILTDIPLSPPVLPTNKEDGLNGAELLVQRSSVVSTAWAAEPAPPIDTVPKAPLSARPVPTEVVLPEFTDVFRKSVGPKFRPDAKVGFSRDSSRPSELVRYWKEETTSNGFHRKAGDPMRTWEAIQAPVKTYAIEANAKYRLAVAELVAASRRALTIAENPETPSTKPEDATVTSFFEGAVRTEDTPKDADSAGILEQVGG